MAAKKNLIFDALNSWRTERPDEPFAPELEIVRDALPAELACQPLKRIRGWLADCERRKAALESEYSYLRNVYSPAFEQPEQQEYALCDLFIPRLRLEIARRGRQTEARTHSNATEKQIDKRAATTSAPRDFQHSDDSRSLVFEGEKHTLTSNQAQVVEILHDAHRSGIPDLGKHYILEKLGTPASRLRDTFKRSKLWRTLIVSGAKRGTYRLRLPEVPKDPSKLV